MEKCVRDLSKHILLWHTGLDKPGTTVVPRVVTGSSDVDPRGGVGGRRLTRSDGAPLHLQRRFCRGRKSAFGERWRSGGARCAQHCFTFSLEQWAVLDYTRRAKRATECWWCTVFPGNAETVINPPGCRMKGGGTDPAIFMLAAVCEAYLSTVVVSVQGCRWAPPGGGHAPPWAFEMYTWHPPGLSESAPKAPD